MGRFPPRLRNGSDGDLGGELADLIASQVGQHTAWVVARWVRVGNHARQLRLDARAETVRTTTAAKLRID